MDSFRLPFLEFDLSTYPILRDSEKGPKNRSKRGRKFRTENNGVNILERSPGSTQIGRADSEA